MSEANAVVIERVFNAPVERVWAAWSEPKLMKQWWGPKHFTAPTVELDFREGGKALMCMRGAPAEGMPEQDFWSTGTYKEIVPLKKIVVSDSFADADGNIVPAASYGMNDFPDELEITVEFEALDDGRTKMVLTHRGAPAGENANNMEQGWNEQLDKLTELLG